MKTCFFVAVVVLALGCAGSSKPPESSEPTEAPDSDAEKLEALIESATTNALEVNERDNCHFFDGETREQVAEGFREEVEQGIDNDQVVKKEFGLKCVAEKKTCSELKECVNMMD